MKIHTCSSVIKEKRSGAYIALNRLIAIYLSFPINLPTPPEPQPNELLALEMVSN